MRVGFHVNIGGGLMQSIKHARDRHCQTMQIFASTPLQWKPRKVNVAEAEEFVAARKQYDIWPLFIHAAYLLNLATADTELLEKSIKRLIVDMQMAHMWEAEGVVLHLGSAGTEVSMEEACERVAAALRVVLGATEGPTKLILENSAGQGKIVGDTPEELCRVVELTGGERLALCFDTAHAFAAGYAVNTPEGLDRWLGALEKQCGLQKLAVVHANDSASELGAKWDRHAHIGKGKIGVEGWKVILGDERLRGLPFILETPKDGGRLESDLMNLEALRELAS